MDPTHPPLDFPVLGLAEWSGPQWFAMIDGRLGHPADGVRLHHGSGISHDAHEPWVRVQTQKDGQLPPSDSRTAFSAAISLVDATMPAPEVQSEDYKDRIMMLAERRSQAHQDWPRVTWTVDGRPVTAAVTHYAGAWAGFTTELSGVEVVVVAHDVDPDGLALVEVVDSSSYHFDSRRPLTFPDTLEASWAAAGIDRSAGDDIWWPAHPDHARV